MQASGRVSESYRLTDYKKMIFYYILPLGVFSAWCYGIPIQKYSQNTDWMTSKLQRPPVPIWPDKFTSDFYIYVEQYGEDFHPKGTIFYDWTKKV